jgi:hypothetical protein
MLLRKERVASIKQVPVGVYYIFHLLRGAPIALRGREPVWLVCAPTNFTIASGKQSDKRHKVHRSCIEEKRDDQYGLVGSECKAVVPSVARRVIGPARKSSKPQARKAERDPPN